MTYRRTPRIEVRLTHTRERIVEAALKLIAVNGYKGASMAAIAAEAGVSTGLLYRYFPSKSRIFDEVFRRASTREIEACKAAAAGTGSYRERLARVISTFAQRAFRGRRLAWALLIEPVDPALDAERLRFRAPYREIFSSLLTGAEAAGEIRSLDVEVVASAIVGAVVESLTGPLSTVSHRDDEDRIVEALTRFCMQAVGYAEVDDPTPVDKGANEGDND